MEPLKTVRKATKSLVLVLVFASLQSCYFFNYFKKSETSSGGGGAETGAVLGQSLGNKASGVDETALAAVYAVSTSIAPAAIRLDPDLYARKLMLQYRDEGSTVARQIGELENYRSLLGGASQDFQTKPQEEYDATSLLTTLTVATEVCEGLVNPSEWEHSGWSTILPAAPDSWEENIKFLAQRFIGKPSSKIEDSVITELKAILDSVETEGGYTNESYIPVCATLALDAEALFL